MPRLTKERIERDWRIVLHLRTLRDIVPASQDPATVAAELWVQAALLTATPIFRQHGLHLAPVSCSSIVEPELIDLDSTGTLTPTAEQQRLVQRMRAAAPPPAANEIALFLVSTIVVPGQPLVRGHSLTVDNLPCAFISELADDWTVAHELGHLLGLDHEASDPARLMYGDEPIVAIPRPILVWEELKKIRLSDLLHP